MRVRVKSRAAADSKPIWDEPVGETDAQIDLLSEKDYDAGKERARARVMTIPKTKNEILNKAKNLKAMKRLYPNEKWINATELQNANEYTKNIVMPKNVTLAKSRIPKNRAQAAVLIKELKQVKILSDLGSHIALTPEPGLYKMRVSDAIINGYEFELRNIFGNARSLEGAFGDAKKKDKDINVFLNIDSNISKNETRRRIVQVLNRHEEYTGKILVSFKEIVNKKEKVKLYYWDTKGLR